MMPNQIPNNLQKEYPTSFLQQPCALNAKSSQATFSPKEMVSAQLEIQGNEIPQKENQNQNLIVDQRMAPQLLAIQAAQKPPQLKKIVPKGKQVRPKTEGGKYDPTHMESFYGYVETHRDAALLLTAMELKSPQVKPIMRRLLSQERNAIRSGSVYVFSERESGMKRWTDGMRWSKSRVEGQFLCYKRMDWTIDFNSQQLSPVDGAPPDVPLMPPAKRRAVDDGGDNSDYKPSQSSNPNNPSSTDWDCDKMKTMWKKCFAIDVDGSVCHVVNYYTKRDIQSGHLTTPKEDPGLSSLEIVAKFLNPDNFRLHSRPVVASHSGPLSASSAGGSFESVIPVVNDRSAILNGPGSRSTHAAVAETLLVQKRGRSEKYVTCHKRNDPQLMRISLPDTFEEFVETVFESFEMDPQDNISFKKLNNSNKDVTKDAYATLESGDILQMTYDAALSLIAMK